MKLLLHWFALYKNTLTMLLSKLSVFMCFCGGDFIPPSIYFNSKKYQNLNQITLTSRSNCLILPHKRLVMRPPDLKGVIEAVVPQTGEGVTVVVFA